MRLEASVTSRLGATRHGLRCANRLAAWIDVDDDGTVTAAGYCGGGVIGRTKVNVGRITFSAIALPDLREPPQGASPVPRHWLYDDGGVLVAKVGVTDFDAWYHSASFTSASSWGNENNPAIGTAAETALERELSTTIMRGGAGPEIRYLTAGSTLVRQGEPGSEIYLLVDGVVTIDVDGRPGATSVPVLCSASAPSWRRAVARLRSLRSRRSAWRSRRRTPPTRMRCASLPRDTAGSPRRRRETGGATVREEQ